MCGIAGIINIDGQPVSSTVLNKMVDSIKHRGPDGNGFYTNKNIGFGHCRLSIIDLSSSGSQPMVSNNNRFVLTYNGEIYNFKELRLELENLGHKFHSKTDSEVVLNAWVEWGEKSILKFNGMFAFAIWDKKKQNIFLVRDRYGIKPLYYAKWGDIILFASEQKAILKHPKAVKKIDKTALFEYFTFQNIFTDKTLIENIKLLKPASIAKIEYKKSNKISIFQYWDYHFKESHKSKNKFEYLEELDRLLKQSVSRQLISDVELGSYLSGGMDSGTLTALASKELPYIKTFTCGFDLSSASGLELAFDEREKAEAMSAFYKTEHYEMVLKSGDMERILPKFSWHLEEPRVGQSYPNYYAAGLASKFVKVVLSGAGGDELFGGYPWRYYRAVKSIDFDHYIDQYYSFWQRTLSTAEIKQVFNPIWDEIGAINTQNIFKDVFSTHQNELRSPEDYINHSLYFEAKTFLHGLFVVEDKLSMAHSMETRVPFMDNDLVDFAMKCPVDLKLKNLTEIIQMNENELGGKKKKYFKKTNDGKQILREVMAQYVPKSISEGIKQGFSSPDASWFKGESIDYVRNKIINKKSPIYNYLDFDSVSKLVNVHLNGHENRRLLIWSLLNINQYFKNEGL
ncbi:MAG: asparagine synthase (glutamine-hydrolyzing) [Candidatus Marinimicrobia bacterium]|nr:asparagine synthase (glutamine-hydrolyzing) [Candidatus Neomarinimicrobiota bacterium]|tara:strand:+ start:1749 stop:3626 length:1878 start_codon:yes stop_codon:yes gene_type:complete